MTFSVRKIHPDAIIPTKKNRLDAGFDLYALSDVVIEPWSQVIVDTGLELASLPDFSPDWNSVMIVKSRSGLAAKFGVEVGAGVIDSTYRGPILVLLHNLSESTVTISYKKAIAQAVIVPCYVGDVVEVSETNETERGATGGITEAFGGTTENFKTIGFAPKEKYAAPDTTAVDAKSYYSSGVTATYDVTDEG